MNKEILVSVLGGVLRLVLGSASLWLVEKGIATQGQIELAIAGLAGFLGVVVWMWLNKIKARVELLTGLTAKPGTTVNELKDQIAAGCAVPASTPNDATPRAVQDSGSVKTQRGKMGAWLLPVLLVSSLVSTSACAGSPRAKLVRSHQAAQITLATIDDTERVLCNGSTTVPTVNANRCPTEAAKTAGLTDAKHQAIHAVLDKGYRAQIDLADVIDAWTPGTKVNLTVLMNVAKELQELVGTLTSTPLPDLVKLIHQVDEWKAEIDRLRELFGKGGTVEDLNQLRGLLDQIAEGVR